MGVPPRRAAHAGTTSSSSPPSWPACRCSTTSEVGTEVCIGPNADRAAVARHPDLRVRHELRRPVGQEAKTALARGAELAGTGICSGEGGMLPEEQAENSRYFYELASARFGWSFDHLAKVQAFHFKGGQGAKTGTGGHLPGPQGGGPHRRGARPARGHAGRVAAALPRLALGRRLPALRRRRCARRRAASRSGSSCRPSTSRTTSTPRWRSGVDYVILDGRGGGTGAAPLVFRDNISVPDHPRAGPGPGPPRPPRPARRHPGGHRRPAPRPRLRQGAGPGRRRGGGGQLGHPGHRLPRHAGLPHRQLPGGHRHPEAAPAGPAAGRRGRPPARPVPAGLGRAHAGAGPGLRPLAPPRVRARRPDHVRPRHGPPHRHRLRRGDGRRERETESRRGRAETASSTLAPGGRRSTSWTTAGSRPCVAGHRSLALTRVRRPLRRARQPLPPPGRSARRGLDREGPAALPVARLRLRPAHRHAAAGVLATRPPASRSRCATTASTSPSPTEPAHVRTVSDVMVETMVAWGVTHVFGMVGHSNLGFADAMRRQEEAGQPDASSASATRARPRSRRRPTASSPGGRRPASASPGRARPTCSPASTTPRSTGRRCWPSRARCRRRCSGRGAFQDVDLDRRLRRRGRLLPHGAGRTPTTPS